MTFRFLSISVLECKTASLGEYNGLGLRISLSSVCDSSQAKADLAPSTSTARVTDERGPAGDASAPSLKRLDALSGLVSARAWPALRLTLNWRRVAQLSSQSTPAVPHRGSRGVLRPAMPASVESSHPTHAQRAHLLKTGVTHLSHCAAQSSIASGSDSSRQASSLVCVLSSGPVASWTEPVSQNKLKLWRVRAFCFASFEACLRLPGLALPVQGPGYCTDSHDQSVQYRFGRCPLEQLTGFGITKCRPVDSEPTSDLRSAI